MKRLILDTKIMVVCQSACGSAGITANVPTPCARCRLRKVYLSTKNKINMRSKNIKLRGYQQWRKTCVSTCCSVNVKWYHFLSLIMCPYEWVLYFVWSTPIQLAISCLWSVSFVVSMLRFYVQYKIDKSL